MATVQRVDTQRTPDRNNLDSHERSEHARFDESLPVGERRRQGVAAHRLARSPWCTRDARSPERVGLALPTALFAMVLLMVLATGAFVMTDLNTKGSRNREGWVRATHLAEAGMNHALAVLRDDLADTTLTRLLRGWDGTKNTADDGLLIGYGLASALEVPAAGVTFSGGTYRVQILDDPSDVDGDPLTDSNLRVLMRCRAVTIDGSEAELNAIISNFVLPGVSVNGSLEISGKLKLIGKCGGIHTNGNMTGGGEPTVTTAASATGTVSVNVSPKLSGQVPVEIPELDPMDFCADADYTISGNFVLRSTTAAGTYCVLGNVTSSGDFGSWASKKSISIIATGSIQISSKPFIKAAHPDGILLLAGGDLDFQGDWGGEGIVYGGGHCYISSKPIIAGQLICMSKPDPPGAIDRTDYNLISGDAEVTYGCTGYLADQWHVRAWYPTVGS
jgi:hypothetical protein